MSVITVKDKKHFNELIKSNPKVAIDFTATWCGPCKVIGPKFANLAGQFPEVAFLKVDVDEVSEVAQAQSITAMPTFQFFIEGKQSEKHKPVIGANLPTLTAALEALKKEKVGNADKVAAPAAPAAEQPKKEDAAPAPAAKKTEEAAPATTEQPKKEVAADADKAPAAAPAA
ncbi:thioredoxin trx1 [Coemansia sp. RSA 1694]|nr:thioredoxin trx1 [Coemansia sp. RSA 2052]KAJ2584270.1 thioredoxin trx1 [Coemansia sp. RSA 1836]KAJ2605564.1 thioredoxin trx1 [Coemansia sp. RSA 1694]